MKDIVHRYSRNIEFVAEEPCYQKVIYIGYQLYIHGLCYLKNIPTLQSEYTSKYTRMVQWVIWNKLVWFCE